MLSTCAVDIQHSFHPAQLHIKVTLMDRLLRQELTTTTSRAVAGRMDDVPGLHAEYTSDVKENS